VPRGMAGPDLPLPDESYNGEPMRETQERYFEFARLEANWKTEILAGFTTFMTMAYIQVYLWNDVID
jgi:hypothetical protein